MSLDLQRYNAQYHPIAVDTFPNAHDRFLCIDETVYHVGASLKNLGKKWFAFNKMEGKTEMLMEKMKDISRKKSFYKKILFCVFVIKKSFF